MEWPGREADHSLLSNAVIKNDWQRFPNYVPLNAVVQRDVNKFSVKKSSNKKNIYHHHQQQKQEQEQEQSVKRQVQNLFQNDSNT